MYLCIAYGIVIIKMHSSNKRVISIKYSCIAFFLILANTQRKGNPKTSVVYHNAPTYIYMQHLTPRQTLRSTYIHIALLYVTLLHMCLILSAVPLVYGMTICPILALLVGLLLVVVMGCLLFVVLLLSLLVLLLVALLLLPVSSQLLFRTLFCTLLMAKWG